MIDKKKVLLVCSPYYKDVTKNLIDGAAKILKSNSIEYKIFYKNVFDLLIDIKGVGENTVFKNVKKGLKTKKYLDVLKRRDFNSL